jgi:hypothetical protein
LVVSFVTLGLAGFAGCGAPEETADNASQTAGALVDHLDVPPVYDNATKAQVWGQTFIAADSSFGGVRVYIGDPSHPDAPTLNDLQGPAELVVFDVSDISHPRRLGTEPFLARGATASGLTTITLEDPLPTVAGKKYFFGIDACDDYGIGLRAAKQSTYPDGAESTLIRETGVIAENPLGRDLSFQVFPGRRNGPHHAPYPYLRREGSERYRPQSCR